MLPARLLKLRPALARYQEQRAKVQQRLFITTVHGAFCVVLLSGLLGYAFLEKRLIYYRRSVLAFNPDVTIGRAQFRLLKAEFLDWPGGPSCTHYDQEVLLIHTTATRFEEFIAYSRRIASPNDHNLTAVFVRDTIAGQPWQALAKRGFRKAVGRVIIPANWVAKLDVLQGGMERDAVHSSLIDLRGYMVKRGLRIWRVDMNYHTDSLTEHQWYWCPSCDSLPAQKKLISSRRLAPSDAVFYSPYRQRVLRWNDTELVR